MKYMNQINAVIFKRAILVRQTVLLLVFLIFCVSNAIAQSSISGPSIMDLSLLNQQKKTLDAGNPVLKSALSAID